MASSYELIIKEFNTFLSKAGGKYSDYYVGITDDVDRRLFGEHNVDRKRDQWIYDEANSDAVARQVEKYFLDKGCDGGTGGGDIDSTIVYCYKKTASTIE